MGRVVTQDKQVNYDSQAGISKDPKKRPGSPKRTNKDS